MKTISPILIAVSMVLASSGSLAQTSGKASPSRDESAGNASPDGGTLEEVTVSAQRREERLKDVPISISVLRGEDLDNAASGGVTEALGRVSGVATTQTWQGGGTQVAVRGVTAGGPLFNGSSPIGYYIDSVPFGLVKTAIAPDSNAYDLQRVEVLRGPQGTLYGASAMNGVVRVLTHDADLDKFELKARTSVSGTEGGGVNYRGDTAVNVPLIDGKLAARAVAGYQSLSGWIDRPLQNDANDGEVGNFRLKVNAQPSDALSVGLSAWISRADYGAPSIGGGPRQNTSLIREPMSTDYGAYGLKIAYEFSRFSISSMTSYVDYQNDGDLDFLVFAVPSTLSTGLDSTVFTQEINVNSNSQGPWRWSFGAIYREAEDGFLQTLPGFFIPPFDWTDFSTSTAVFGELTRLFLDGRLELTVGLRHFEDKVETREHQSAVLPLIRTEDKFDADSPRFVINWHPTSDVTVYGSYAEGFRSGFNQNPGVARASSLAPLKADTLKNYELGTKGGLWGGLLSLEATVYYIDWQDVQQTQAVMVNDVPLFAFVNGDSASGMGFDFAVTAQPAGGLALGVNFSWNDLTWDQPVAAVAGSSVLLFDKGDRLNYSPEYTVGTSADYDFPIGGGAFTGKLSASVNYASEQNFRTVLGTLPVATRGDAMLIGGTSFSLTTPSGWAGMLFIDNVSNEQGVPVGAPYGKPDWSPRVRPRTLGLQIDYKF